MTQNMNHTRKTITNHFLLIFAAIFTFINIANGNDSKQTINNNDVVDSKTELSDTMSSVYFTPDFTVKNVLNDSILLSIKQMLLDGCKIKHYKKYKMDSIESVNNTKPKKDILNVGWFDEDYNKIESAFHYEMISIFILTKGYVIGDTISVTIDAVGEEDLITDCKNITFKTVLEHKNIAVFKDIFYVEGEDEQVIINPIWENRCDCK